MTESIHNPRGRLQRKADRNGSSIDSFRLVLIRHGLTMSLLLIMCLGLLFYAGVDSLSSGQISGSLWADGAFTFQPLHYAMLIAMLAFACGHWLWRGVQIQRHTLMWLVYLALIAFVEELLFRLVAPQLMQSFIGSTGSVIVSNIVFAGLHFFTLRWRWHHCIVVFLGGLGLSRLLQVTDDFVLIVLVHWFFTFLNTPHPPKVKGAMRL